MLSQSDYHSIPQSFPSTENRHDPMSRAPRGRRQPDGTGVDFGSAVKFVPVLPTWSNRGRSARRSGRSKSQKLKDLEFGTTPGNFLSGAFTPRGTFRESMDLPSPGAVGVVATSLYEPRDWRQSLYTFFNGHGRFGTGAELIEEMVTYCKNVCCVL
ncbi:hypothetical protein B0H21DRAFT_97751 [Amylocystis lapponica]|nr:hypothetical protein B0H21DRAFT_97751 [Amylocystis lapponica]